MFNWYDLEYLARSRARGDSLSAPERLRLEALQDLEASRKALRSRLAAALVRIGARLDPKTIEVKESADDSVVEGRLAAYLR